MKSEGLLSNVQSHNERESIDMTTKETRRAADCDNATTQLSEQIREHPYWKNRLFTAIQADELTRKDYQYLFSQYYHYSNNFTRFIAAAMVHCENDLHRFHIIHNLWEEAGEGVAEKRHPQLYRDFLRGAFDVNKPDEIKFADYTRQWVKDYLENCLRPNPLEALAFIVPGEQIVPATYKLFLAAMQKVGITDEALFFWHLHTQCDDEHGEILGNIVASYAPRRTAKDTAHPKRRASDRKAGEGNDTLEKIMNAYAVGSDWHSTSAAAMNRALNLHMQFYENVFDTLRSQVPRSVAADGEVRAALR